MITRTVIKVQFPAGASFSEAPALAFYRKLLGGIKRFSCMSSGSKCKECSYSKDCRYYWITGDNFQTYPGLLCKTAVFDQRIFHENDETEIELVWIGETEDFSVLVEPLLDQLENRIDGQLFYIRSVNQIQNQSSEIKVKNLRLLTPVRIEPNKNLLTDMAAEYERRYHTELIQPDSDYEFKKSVQIDSDKVRLPSRLLRVSGFTGYLVFDKETEIDSTFLITGIGLTNCIGGGQIEIDNHIQE